MTTTAGSPILRTPPHSKEAEICVLGSMVLDINVIPDVLGITQANEFFQPCHRVLFEALREMNCLPPPPRDHFLQSAYRTYREIADNRGGSIPGSRRLAQLMPQVAEELELQKTRFSPGGRGRPSLVWFSGSALDEEGYTHLLLSVRERLEYPWVQAVEPDGKLTPLDGCRWQRDERWRQQMLE